MKAIACLALAGCLFSVTAAADKFAGAYGACLSEDLFDEWVSAVANDDWNAISYLMGNGCIISKPGIPVSVLHRGFMGAIKVRAYAEDGTAFVLWTYTENLIEE